MEIDVYTWVKSVDQACVFRVLRMPYLRLCSDPVGRDFQECGATGMSCDGDGQSLSPCFLPGALTEKGDHTNISGFQFSR